MRPSERDPAYLWDMLKDCELLQEFVKGKTLVDFQGDALLRSASERQIEIIGEAARGVSQELKDAHPEIPWRPIMAQRHVLAHDYGKIDYEKIWRVATGHVPALMTMLRPLVPPLPNEEV